jgi:hypothetical protein
MPNINPIGLGIQEYSCPLSRTFVTFNGLNNVLSQAGWDEATTAIKVALEVVAKSFVSRRCPNFYFSRPHKIFMGPILAGC